ncbi:MAG: AarF/ABC1/UbiB kinase family protein [Candidatus Melainabacteria bacterium]|nr:AarF/ABC1/UbiB kinase family protein [Candidatus Melainabacteria bacterium]
MIFKIIKSLYIISLEVFSVLSYKGLKRFFSFLQFGTQISFYIWLDHKDFRNDSFLFYICSKFDPFLLISKEERDQKRAKWLLEQILLHGTTFIKLGQILATRADFIPLVYMKELAKLQDEVPPFDNNTAFEIIRTELIRPITSIFSEIDFTPMASASLGQVYKGKILDTDKEVIIKVQRPGLKELIENDVFILKAVAKEITKYPKISRGNDYYGLLDEFLKVINEEIDYIKEGKHCDLFRKNFKSYHRVYVPKVYWQFTTRKVITLEHIHGWKVTEKEKIIQAGFNLKEITKEGCNVYLKQLLTDGFFHADPHPGNLRIMEDGRLAFFDFGMVGYVSKDTQIKLINTILHLINRDYKNVVNDFILMGFLDKDFNKKDELAKTLKPIYDARFGHSEDITTSFKQIIEALAHIIYEYPFKIPVEFALIMRALLTLEGVGHALDPGFNIIKALIPFIQKYMFTKEGDWIRNHLVNQIMQNGFTLSNAKQLLKASIN